MYENIYQTLHAIIDIFTEGLVWYINMILAWRIWTWQTPYFAKIETRVKQEPENEGVTVPVFVIWEYLVYFVG